MLNFFKNLRESKKTLRTQSLNRFNQRTYKENPGFSVRTLDDLRFEALEFEKLIRNFIEVNSGLPVTGRLNKLLEKDFPEQVKKKKPTYILNEEDTISTAKELKEIRNKIIHSDFEGLPNIAQLYIKFHEFNKTLNEFRICSANSSRFKFIGWDDLVLHIKIDNNNYKLEPEDINNLLLELDPSSRGRVHFVKGRLVVNKMLDYNYENTTYFIEDFPPFELNNDEAMVLENFLNTLIFNRQLDK